MLKSAGVGMCASAALFGYGDLGTDWLTVEWHDLSLKNWDADGFRVAVVSDIHANSDREARVAAEACKIAVAEKPDIIVLPGDFVNFSDPITLQHLKVALGPLRNASCPVLGTLGNHDYWTRNPETVMSTVRRWGVNLLRNESIDLNGVTVFGIDDAIAGLHRPDVIRSGEHAKSLLTLFHEPDFVSEVPRFVSLQISGHSHGGQVCLPGGISLHTPRGARKYIAGFFEDSPVPLYVTRGVGTVGPRIRLFCRPEVSILTLRGA